MSKKEALSREQYYLDTMNKTDIPRVIQSSGRKTRNNIGQQRRQFIVN